MPPPRDVEEVAALAAWVERLPPLQRERLYLELLARGHVVQRIAPMRPPIDRTPSESLPRDQRDFLQRTIDWPEGPPASRDKYGQTAADRKSASRRMPVKIRIYDPTNAVAPGTGETVAKKIAAQLQAVDVNAGPRWQGHLQKLGATFDVRWTRNEPSAAAKAQMQPLDYPIYLLDDDKAARRPLAIVDEHQLPVIVPGSRLNIRDHIRSQWGGSLRGTAAAPGRGVDTYRKCAFLKTSIVQEGHGSATLIANAALHELGHVFNILSPEQYAHPIDDSVMRTARSTADMMSGVLPFNAAHAQDILKEIARQWGISQRL